MPIRIHHLAPALLLSSFILHPSSLLAQGSLTPPGVPAPTMKTLAQIEPRTPISSAPFIIIVPGSYYLTTNLTTTVSNAITITASDVTLDLGGFTIASTVASAANGGTGILLGSALSDITIYNGHIRGGVTNNGSGVFSGSGFGNGIYYDGTKPVNAHVSGVSVAGCLYQGLHVGADDSTVVESCTVRTVGGYGIYAGIVHTSAAKDCGLAGITGNQVSASRGESAGSDVGLWAITAQHCYGYSHGSGTGLSATTAQNCSGYSSSGTGLYASTAQNCSGYSIGGGIGLSATTAVNCYGSSSSGYGMNASTAQNCWGASTSGTGLYASTAQNCYGYSTSGAVGLSAYNASFCIGSRYPGVAIQATIATGCIAISGTNSITYKYNMP